MFKKHLFALVVAPLVPLFGTTLLSNIQRAEEGDYLVAQQNRTCTLILVSQKADNRVVLEEVTLPQRAQAPNWKEWLQNGAPNHSSWIAHIVDTRSGRVMGTYSYTQDSWLRTSPQDTLLSTLITLDFQEVPETYRRRVGPPPMGGKDTRPFWQPTLIYEGARRREAKFVALEGAWPRDRSELEGRRVTIYMPAGEAPYPSHFPYWVEVSPTTFTNKIHVIDSGKALASPRRKLF